MKAIIWTLPITLSALILPPLSTTWAQETCGDSLDNDGDNLADEGCNPYAVTGINETPIPSSATGIVSPKTGQLIWTEPADISPAVAFGPAIDFQRTYLSLFDSGYNDPSATDYRAPLGYGWHHNYMSWLDRDTTPNPDEVIVHLTTGQDVLFTYTSTVSGHDYYQPQPGHHVDYLRQSTMSPFAWELRTLEGVVFEYNWAPPTGKLSKIRDSIGNAITVTYNASGQVDRVTDASGYKQLHFVYQEAGARALHAVSYYNDGVLRVTVQFGGAGYGYDLGTVTIGDDSARRYTYLNHKLARIQDATSTLAEFKYLSSTLGKAVRIETGSGHLGYKYGDPSCNSGDGVFLYFGYRDDTATRCDASSDCGVGEFCGGELTPGVGNTGVCFRARRCAAWLAGNEDLVGAVTSSCPTCTETAEYAWNGGSLNLNGRKDAEGVWTSYLYNSNGLVVRQVENDNDSNASTIPSNPNNPARVTYFKYENSLFPGLVTNRRRLSELAPSGTCSDTIAVDCKQTIYAYTSSGLLDTVTEIGNTYNSAGQVSLYNHTVDYDYDAQGRLTRVDGPRTDTVDDVIEFTFHNDNDADHLRAGYLKEIKRKKDASTYLTTTRDSYDAFGNATGIRDQNNKLTCLTYDPDRNVLTARRISMSNQSSCIANPADLVTTYLYDSSVRRTRLQRPLGNCIHYAYDSRGRLSVIKTRDNCNPASVGDNREFTYDEDGLQTGVEYKDGTGTVTHRRTKTYGADRRVVEFINPVHPTMKRVYSYKADGQIASILRENSLGRIDFNYDNLNRLVRELRYLSDITFDEFEVNNCLQLDRRSRMRDDDNKSIDWAWDDMGRKVKEISPEKGTSIFVYDAAGNRTVHVESLGSPDQMNNIFAYDSLNRMTSENYGDARCFALGGAEIQYTYDAATGCPTGACVNVVGRLVRIKTKLWCDDGKSDDTFDQLTYLGYDNAGRLVKETIQDDGGRNAPQTYSWDKNSRQTGVETPSGIDSKWTLGDAGNNSDAEKIVALFRNDGTDTLFVDSVSWFPFGPIRGYRQQNSRNSNKILARLNKDLAYRPNEILYEEENSGLDIYRIAYTLDEKGRVVARDFTGAAPNVRDAYYQYDLQDRITCDGSTLVPACSTGNNVKSRLASTSPYTASGDRRSITHHSPGFALDTFTYVYASGSDQIDYVTKSNAQIVDYGWDGRGNRLYDDDAEFSNDRRQYMYDGRNNLVAHSGKIRIDDWTEHDSTMVNAFDHRNRRIFKGVLDQITGVESQSFFYYDNYDRLIEVKYTPDITDSSVFQLFQFYWIGQRPIAWVQTTYPTMVLSRRFLHSDDLDVPQDGWSWPVSGDAVRVWAIDNDAFGWASILNGGQIYQPLRFPGQHFDEETRVRFWNANEGHYQSLRPALHDNRHRVYDPFLGTYLQADPLLARSWSSYEYARSNPVMRTDRLGLEVECDGSCMDEIINVRGVVDDWGYFDLDGPGTWGWDLPPDHDDRPPRWPVGDEPESAPEREDCHGNYSGKECTDCCYRNYSNVDAPTCRRKRTRTQRQACWALAASTMAACISMCRRDELGPLEPTRSMEEISPGDYRFDGFGGGQFGGGGTGGNF